MLERAAKFVKRAKVRNTIRGVQQGDAIRWNDGMAEWWNILKRGMPCCMKQKSHKNGIAMKCDNVS